MSRAALHRQVSSLLRRGYAPRTFNAAVLEPAGGPLLAVTFDDGEYGVFGHARPVLVELGVPGTVFAPISPVGGPGLMGWDELDALASAGWEIGSHTFTHARLTELDDATLADELRRSREEIEQRLGTPCVSIAYPYGAFDARVREAAAAAGFTAGCAMDTPNAGDVLAWPRVGVDGNDDPLAFRLKTSRTGRALRRTPLGSPLRAAGRRLRALRSG